jgi:enoyl-CoA hydratase/3-hydroxyacyl-CoA dehydrogenase
LALQEGEAFAEAASLDTHKALVHIFFATRSTKKVRDSHSGLLLF